MRGYIYVWSERASPYSRLPPTHRRASMTMMFTTHGQPFNFIADDCDTEWISEHRWYLNGVRHPAKPYTIITMNGKEMRSYLARLITQAKPHLRVRYKNGNRLDCRRKNLWLSRSGGCDPRVLPQRDPADNPLTQS